MNAIKILKKINPKAYSRFIDETLVIEQNSDIEGIIPIIDKYLPNDITKETIYYVLPLAENSASILLAKQIEYKIQAIIDISTTLSQLYSETYIIET